MVAPAGAPANSATAISAPTPMIPTRLRLVLPAIV
jgi:hypothetical protein